MRPLKQFALNWLPRPIVRFVSSIRLLFRGDLLSFRRRLADLEENAGLGALYQMQHAHPDSSLLRTGNTLNHHELRVFSQNGEDGILFYLFSLLGTTDRRFVEFGIGDGTECNTANLSLNFGWSGLLIEADARKASAAETYYRQRIGSSQEVHVVHDTVTVSNINAILLAHDFRGEIDLLSIDIDGNDYWLWEAIDAIQPRVVVIEYNATFGPVRSVTVPYTETFDRYRLHPTGFYHGASLQALTKLASRKGYLLAGCDSSGTNAFFVHRASAAGNLVPIPAEEAYFPGRSRMRSFSQQKQFEQIAGMPLVDVE